METNTLSDLLTYYNARKSRIASAALTLTTHDRAMAAHVEFQDYPPGWSVAVAVEGGPDAANKRLLRDLTAAIEPTLQWYSWLSDNRFWRAIIVILLLLLLFCATVCLYLLVASESPFGVVTVTHPSGETTTRPATATELARYDGAKTAVDLALSNALVIIVFFVRPILFPKGLFLIGHEVHRHEALKKWRWVLLTGVAIPILLRIFA